MPDRTPVLAARRLSVGYEGRAVLSGIDVFAAPGSSIALVGPNGSGKSTFAKVLAGHPAYVVTSGTVLFEGKDLFALAPEERARRSEEHTSELPVTSLSRMPSSA